MDSEIYVGPSEERKIQLVREVYDTEEGIKGMLMSLKLLHQLKAARQSAGYERNERLHEFLILGTFYTDGCGNFGRSEVSLDDKVLGRKDFPPVVSHERLFVLKEMRISTGFGPCLPSQDVSCKVCDRPWTIENVEDATVSRSDGKGDEVIWHHRLCHKLSLSRDSRAFFGKMVLEAGFKDPLMNEIPNEYCKCERCMPWSLLNTLAGDIKVGWRKRVLSISWEGTGIYLPDLFKDEDVTKNGYHVHAWGYGKGVLYLTKLRQALSEAKGGVAL